MKPAAIKKPTKPCKCLYEVKAALEKAYGSGDLNLSMTFNRATGEVRSVVPPLVYTYGKKNVDGTTSPRNRKRIYVELPRCPFCGKKEF